MRNLQWRSKTDKLPWHSKTLNPRQCKLQPLTSLNQHKITHNLSNQMQVKVKEQPLEEGNLKPAHKTKEQPMREISLKVAHKIKEQLVQEGKLKLDLTAKTKQPHKMVSQIADNPQKQQQLVNLKQRKAARNPQHPMQVKAKEQPVLEDNLKVDLMTKVKQVHKLIRTKIRKQEAKLKHNQLAINNRQMVELHSRLPQIINNKLSLLQIKVKIPQLHKVETPSMEQLVVRLVLNSLASK